MSSRTICFSHVLLMSLLWLPFVQAYQPSSGHQRSSPWSASIGKHLKRPWKTNETTNTTTTSSMNTSPAKVFVNPHYQPPAKKIVPVQVPSRRVNTESPVFHPGAHHVLNVGIALEDAAESDVGLPPTSANFLKDAAKNLQDMGRAWQEGDWEAVTYASQEASQSMKLMAQSLNQLHTLTDFPASHNHFQQAMTGISGELKMIASRSRPQAIDLHGLYLRMDQAKSHTLHGRRLDAQTHWDTAASEARRLATLYGAPNSMFVPGRWQRWRSASKKHNST